MGRIWLTSDLHLGHDREFIYKPRGFSSIEEHDNAIVERWNEVVGPNDDVYILGDLMLGDNEHGIELIKKLNGFKHVLLGNHDTDARAALYRQYCISVQYATVIKYKGYRFYLSHYPTMTANLDADKPLKDRIISLCGHSHYQNKFEDMDKGLIFHCELDTNNCYPVLLDDIIEECKNKVIECKEIL